MPIAEGTWLRTTKNSRGASYESCLHSELQAPRLGIPNPRASCLRHVSGVLSWLECSNARCQVYALYPRAARLSLFHRKSEILPPYNAQVCQRIFDGLPFRSMTWQNALNTIEDRGFCRLYSFQELFTFKLQKRNLVFILPFGIKNFGRPRTAHEASCTTSIHCLHKKPSP